MNKRTSFKRFKEDMLKNTAIKEKHEALRPEFECMIQLINARKLSNMSQDALAKKLKVQQPLVARMERGGYALISIAKLSQVADALGYSLKNSLQQKNIHQKMIIKFFLC